MYSLGNLLEVVQKEGFFIANVEEIDQFAGINLDSEQGRLYAHEILNDFGLICFPRIVRKSTELIVDNEQNLLGGKKIVLAKL